MSGNMALKKENKANRFKKESKFWKFIIPNQRNKECLFTIIVGKPCM